MPFSGGRREGVTSLVCYFNTQRVFILTTNLVLCVQWDTSSNQDINDVRSVHCTDVMQVGVPFLELEHETGFIGMEGRTMK